MGKSVAVVNQKGGVGKTSVVLGLASAARAAGHHVLIVDMDPQGASSWVVGVDPAEVSRSVAAVLGNGRTPPLREIISDTDWGALVSLAPSGPDLQRHEAARTGLETIITGKSAPRLRRALDDVRADYDVVLIDCPPSLGDLTTNALVAAHRAVVVVEPTTLSLRGVGPVADLIEAVWEQHNHRLDLAGVIVNRMPSRGADAEARYDELARSVGTSSVWEPAIPMRIVVAEAATQRKPIHDLGARARPVAEAFDQLYRQLWEQIKPAGAD